MAGAGVVFGVASKYAQEARPGEGVDCVSGEAGVGKSALV